MFLAKEVQKAAEQEREEQRGQLMEELTQLHRLLELEEIAEEEFDAREANILDLLEKLSDQ